MREGVVAGSFLGPLLFALVLHPVLSEVAGLRAAGGLELANAYLDDLAWLVKLPL